MYFALWALWPRITHRFLGFSWFTEEVCCLPRKVRCGETVETFNWDLLHLVSTEVLYKVQLNYSYENQRVKKLDLGAIQPYHKWWQCMILRPGLLTVLHILQMGYLSLLTHFKKQKFNTLLLQFKRKNMYFVSKGHVETSAIPGYQNMGYVFCLFTFLKYSRKFPKYWNTL